jgi:2-polyprenyl-3-methyl-5-hydroxy-6-metoxy-1,4-benzoquinol methylase
MSEIDVRDYWEKRLGADWSLRGVGFSRLGTRFNDWQYRLRAERFDAIVQDLPVDLSQSRVLDVGSGTGFYIEAWRRLNAKEVVGLDLTDAAVASLREAFPDKTFVRQDISEGIDGLEPESFDIVSCMDVMFHILDNARFSAALENIAMLLVPGGQFVWSDLFIHRREYVDRHTAWRSLYRVEAILDRIGFDVELRTPMFFVMNEPRDASPVAMRIWRAAMLLACRTDASSDFFGRQLYRLDRRLTASRTESPTTEIMVCRKRDA